jgi:hypothetical protein
VGFECSLENSYSHDSFPLSVKEVFIGSPYNWRTFPLTNCPDTVCCEASAMLSLPLLEHPPRNADESPAATTIRHAITPPNAVAPGTAAHRPAPNGRQPTTRAPIYPVRRITCGPGWDLDQRQCGTPADDSEQKLPRILRSVC